MTGLTDFERLERYKIMKASEKEILCGDCWNQISEDENARNNGLCDDCSEEYA